MKREKKQYEKPAPEEKAVIYPFNDNKQFDIETRKYQNLGHISPWKRIAGNKMLNEDTGEIIDIKKKDKRLIRVVYRTLKVAYRDVKNNIEGNDTERLIIVECEEEITDLDELKRLLKNSIEKLQRKLGDILFIRILLYQEENKPIIHIWIKKLDNTKIELQQETVEQLFGKSVITRVVRLTKRNVDNIARYFYKPYWRKDVYPTGIKIYSTSKNIKKIQPIEVDYAEVDKIVKGCNLTYGGAVSFLENIDEQEEEIQKITYESFERQEGIKLHKPNIRTKYKGTIVRDYKKKQKEKADRNFAEIEKITSGKNCWFEVKRLDSDLCEIIVKSTGKEFNTLDTRQTLILVKSLLNKGKKK